MSNDILNDIQIFVINLEKDLKKRQRFSDEFKEINFDFINAVNGKELSSIEYFKYIVSSKGRAKKKVISPSEVGCFLSHKKAIENFIQSEKNHLLVLEDDVSMKKNIELIKNINFNENRIFILGGQEGLKRPKIFTPFKTENKPIKIPFLFNSFLYRTCCYAFNKKVASEINKKFNESVFLADDWNSIMKKTKIEGLSYLDIFSHPLDLSNSSIEHERRIKYKKNYN